MDCLLGIDLGTSSVKTVLVDSSGSVAARGEAPYPIHRPHPGMAEQHPEEWWQATVTSVRQVVADVCDTVAIIAIGVCGQMHGTVLLDSRNRLLAPAIIWPDQRSERQVCEITASIGGVRLIDLTGSVLVTGFQAASVRWFQQELPALWNQVRRILLPKDYLRWRMTGHFATDPSDGSGTLMFDVRARKWSPCLLETLEIAEEWLPTIQPSTGFAGNLKPDVAQAFGLSGRIPVVVGAGDTPSALLGAGVVDTDRLLLNLSSGGQLALPASDVQVDTLGRIHTFCSALEPGPGQAGWYRLGGTLAAGLALQWLLERVFGLQDDNMYDRMTALAEDVPAGADGLIFLPYLEGERTPYMDPQARAVLIGLTSRHGQPQIVRAVMEGVALACYEAYSVLAEVGTLPEQVVLAGGGARSQVWQKIIADVFALPVQRFGVSEQSALGAAILAGAGIGLFETPGVAHDWAHYGSPILPDIKTHARYQELRTIFRSTYEKHREDFRKLSMLSA